MNITQRLNTIRYTLDETPHIIVEGGKCTSCRGHPCVTFCPAHCFTRSGAGGIDYYYAGCLECGACLVMCNEEAVRWNYPRGGAGIQYRF
jgi:ferredoxin like protein